MTKVGQQIFGIRWQQRDAACGGDQRHDACEVVDLMAWFDGDAAAPEVGVDH